MASLDEELNRLFASDYLDGIQDRSIHDVRAMRAECQEAETVVSYLRRIAQGRLDLVHVYLDGDDPGAELDSVVEHLPAIIGSGPPRPAGYGRLPSQMSPDMESGDIGAEIDGILDAQQIGELPSMSEGDLRSLADRLTEFEARVSGQRRTLHERIDALQAEIVSRYKSGEASVEGLLS